jgi:integrase
LTLDETVRVFRHLAGLPTGMALGFTMALLLGVRQGERLGAIWSEFDLDVGLWDVAWELQRIQYAHGCVDEDGYVTCTAARASGCPSRVEPVVPVDQPVRRLDGGYWLLGVKSERSQRVIPLPSQVVGLVAAWKAQVFRGDCDGLVFTRPDGQPINAAADSRAWAELLRAANVPHVPLHSARHTTATLLAELDVDEQTRMAILGHAGVSVTRRYTHVSVARRLDALSRLGDQLDLPGSSA